MLVPVSKMPSLPRFHIYHKPNFYRFFKTQLKHHSLGEELRTPPNPVLLPASIFPSQRFWAEVLTPSPLLMVICHIWLNLFGSTIRLERELCFSLLCGPCTSWYSVKGCEIISLRITEFPVLDRLRLGFSFPFGLLKYILIYITVSLSEANWFFLALPVLSVRSGGRDENDTQANPGSKRFNVRMEKQLSWSEWIVGKSELFFFLFF